MMGRFDWRIIAAALVVCIVGAGIFVAFTAGDGGGGDDAATTGSNLTITDAYVYETTNDVASLYFTVKNSGAEDTLLSVSSDASDQASIHQDVVEGASSSMKMLEDLTIPAKGEFTFKPGVNHVMLTNVQKPLTAGMTVNVQADFLKGGTVTFAAPVKSR